jgi:hypothetical protein
VGPKKSAGIVVLPAVGNLTSQENGHTMPPIFSNLLSLSGHHHRSTWSWSGTVLLPSHRSNLTDVPARRESCSLADTTPKPRKPQHKNHITPILNNLELYLIVPISYLCNFFQRTSIKAHLKYNKDVSFQVEFVYTLHSLSSNEIFIT